MPAKPKSPFPNPAAPLPGEADVLANVLVDLSDHAAKLVYADWLEEHNDTRGPLLRSFITAYLTGKKLPSVKSVPKPWRDLVGFSVVARARDSVLVDILDPVLAAARPAIAYTTRKAAEKTLPVGTSKFGGRPDLPAGAKWPRFDDRPLSFLGQFNLAELHASPVARELPATGVLSAFCLYDEDDGNDYFPKGSWRLFHFPDPSKLVRTAFDDELEDESRFASCRVEYTEALTLPDMDSPAAEGLNLEDAHPADDVYRDIYYNLCAGDHILGHAFPIQGSIGRKDTRHLLTIGGNGQTGWGFGDGGALYFTLSGDALQKGRFDLVKLVS
jgi:uncharacterized protein (TIGR02996 family)